MLRCLQWEQQISKALGFKNTWFLKTSFSFQHRRQKFLTCQLLNCFTYTRESANFSKITLVKAGSLPSQISIQFRPSDLIASSLCSTLIGANPQHWSSYRIAALAGKAQCLFLLALAFASNGKFQLLSLWEDKLLWETVQHINIFLPFLPILQSMYTSFSYRNASLKKKKRQYLKILEH